MLKLTLLGIHFVCFIHILDLTHFQYVTETYKLGLWLQKLDLHVKVKVTLKSAKPDLCGMQFTGTSDF